jgi:serine/threonine protein kinase/peptidoglycan hydrolase-like protein with peptidoglycan-binding domain
MTDLSDYAALAPGQTVGRYEIQATLGQGGFGITYRARDAQLGRDVAIKEYLPAALAVRQGDRTVLPRSTKVAEDFNWGRERFVAEGRTLASLQRAPGIVRVFDFLEANGTAYIVMELVPGDTLETRLRHRGKLEPTEVGRILWPLLDGLEQVHGTGFLHRDIKPANILLDAAGNPTLIDFGASRAAVAGRNTAMTAVFTPGYAAPEQFTSARQGPWTDIYSVSATIYHAITGAPPPSAFDRMLDDAYQPLGRLIPAGFPPGLLVGIDAGLAVRASDRPQSIAGWRPILGHAGTMQDNVTVAMAKPTIGPPVRRSDSSPAPASAPSRTGRSRRFGIGRAALIVVAIIGGTYLVARPDRAGPGPTNTEEARRKADADLAKERRKQEEEQREAAAEQAERQRKQEEALREARRKAAETESALGLTTADRQRAQVALTALGFDTGGTDGTFGTRTREMIAAWQKARGDSGTGFLSGRQNQALLNEAAPAVSRFDEARRLEEARKREDEKARVSTVPPLPPGPDGVWRGTYSCGPSQAAGTSPLQGLTGEFTSQIQLMVSGGTGTWVRPGATPEKGGNQSITVKISGAEVQVRRDFVPYNQPGKVVTATLSGRFEGNIISGSGPEANSGGRTCNISLTRAQ